MLKAKWKRENKKNQENNSSQKNVFTEVLQNYQVTVPTKLPTMYLQVTVSL